MQLDVGRPFDPGTELSISTCTMTDSSTDTVVMGGFKEHWFDWRGTGLGSESVLLILDINPSPITFLCLVECNADYDQQVLTLRVSQCSAFGTVS
jgi:hypothetical protein